MRKLAPAAALMLVAGAGGAVAQGQRFEGVSLNLASQNDQFAGVLVKLVPRAKEDLGLDVRVDILSYPELLTKITADFVGNTQGYDLVTMDIVWAGQFAEAQHSVDLSPLIERDRAQLDLADIYPVLFHALGHYEGQQVGLSVRGLCQRAGLPDGPLRGGGPRAARDDGRADRGRAEAYR
jgi:multiple sugar transport system substrate-binding protein